MSRRRRLRGVASSLRRIVVRVLPYLRKQRYAIGVASLALFAEVILRLLEPWPLKFIFDVVAGFVAAEGSAAFPAALPSDPMTLLLVCALAIPVITGLRALAAYWNAVGFALVGNRVLTDLRGDLFRHLNSLSLSYHSKARSGDLIVRVIGDVGLLKDATVTALLPLLAHSIVFVGMLGVLFWLHWRLTLVALAVAPLLWLLTQRLTRRIHSVSRRQRKREGAMATTVAESIGAMRVVQSLSLERSFEHTFSAQNEQGFREGVQGKRLAARLERSVDFLVAIATGLAVWYGAHLVLVKELTPGDLFVVVTYLRRCFRPLKDFAKYSARLAKAAAAGERVLEVLDRPVEVQDLPGARPAPEFRGAVSFEKVSFAYEAARPVLEELSFQIDPGQSVVVIGAAGVGKSTLASLLLRLHDPSRGCIRIDGGDIRDYTIESLRRQISIVLQEPVLFAGTVAENIAYGREGASMEEVEQAARLIGIDRFIDTLPDGYDTPVGERGIDLSSGQRQLIAASRAAIRDAPLLILDEPTSSLDGENARMVHEALDRLARSRTTLLITHDLVRAAQVDLILHLGHGRLLEVGSHAELMRSNGPYALLYRQQVPKLRLASDGGPPRALGD
ncbi:MAG: ABC transporter ATP-binding protein [Myxococcales bacterium]|nr:ABC transporter ATP-binding protein [Myxococcales bacterium]